VHLVVFITGTFFTLQYDTKCSYSDYTKEDMMDRNIAQVE